MHLVGIKRSDWLLDCAGVESFEIETLSVAGPMKDRGERERARNAVVHHWLNGTETCTCLFCDNNIYFRIDSKEFKKP